MSFSRRDFVKTAALGSLSLGLHAQQRENSASGESKSSSFKRPIIICAGNGFNYLDEAYSMLRGGADTLDAAMRVIRGPEDDPNNSSVGLDG